MRGWPNADGLPAEFRIEKRVLIGVLAAQTTELQFNCLAGNVIAKPESPKPETILAVLLWINQFFDWMSPGAVVRISLEDLDDFAEEVGEFGVMLAELIEQPFKPGEV